ncbi:MAG: hypothetical protein A2096_01340 [Spirochaetes bacterium GWF1_41_5]|nr:MAG: hypothetical protein A2096_01340 [Spirochaetes bacterium GWF1_41_5]HBE01571.1 hypothetical protein [Spirochaetia bacterium]
MKKPILILCICTFYVRGILPLDKTDRVKFIDGSIIAKNDTGKPTLITIDYSDIGEFGPFIGYNLQTVAEKYNFDNPELFKAVRELKPAYLRFPGGSAGNWYHWETDGFKDEEVAYQGHNWGRSYMPFAQIHGDGKLGFVKFLEFCKKLKTEPSILFNIYTEDTDSPAKFVKYIKKLNIIPVKYGMLGCENFCRPQAVLKFSGGIKEFIAAAEEAVKKIKEVDSDINLAVNLENFSVTAGIPGDWDSANLWDAMNKARNIDGWNSTILEKKDVFDAIEVHYYLANRNCLKISETDNVQEWYFKNWRYLVFFQLDYINAMTKELDKYSPKPIWQDEGGLAYYATTGTRGRISRSMMAALNDAEYIFALGDMYPKYKRVLRHCLSSSKVWGILGNYDIKTGTFEVHPPRYYVLKLLADINGCTQRLKCNISNFSQIKGLWSYENKSMSVINAKIFRNDQVLYIYIVNRGPDNEKIEINSSKQLIYPEKIEYVGGYLDVTDYERCYDMDRSKIEEKAINGSSFEVAPFSLTRLTVKINE